MTIISYNKNKQMMESKIDEDNDIIDIYRSHLL